jgi:hypothetical protein
VAGRGRSGSSARKGKQRGKTLWKVYGRLSTVVAGLAALRAVNLAWRVVTGKKAPATPENPDVAMWEAVVWAVVSGAAAQLAKIVVTRKAVHYWVRTTGELPPGIEPSQVSPGITKD